MGNIVTLTTIGGEKVNVTFSSRHRERMIYFEEEGNRRRYGVRTEEGLHMTEWKEGKDGLADARALIDRLLGPASGTEFALVPAKPPCSGSDLIRAYLNAGYKAETVPDQRLVKLYTCNLCGKNTVMRFIHKNKPEVFACGCGGRLVNK